MWRRLIAVCVLLNVLLLAYPLYVTAGVKFGYSAGTPGELAVIALLGNIAATAGLGKTVGAALCVILTAAVALTATATFAMIFVPMGRDAVKNISSDLAELDAFRLRGNVPWGGWKLRDLIFYPALFLAVGNVYGIFINILADKPVAVVLPWLGMFAVCAVAAYMTAPDSDRSGGGTPASGRRPRPPKSGPKPKKPQAPKAAPQTPEPPQTAEVLRPQQFRRPGTATGTD